MTTQLSSTSAAIDRWAAERPDREALRYGEQSWTWAELADRVRRGAAAQRAAGLRPGDRVAVLDLNHPSCLEITLACARVGTANAVVNFRLAPPEIAYVINDSKARILFVGPEFADAAEQLRASLPGVERIVRIGGEADEYEAWLDVEPDDATDDARPDDCFVQLYTSGTTGFPKGAMLTHRGLLAHSMNLSTLVPMQAGDRVLVAMPLFHVGGTSYALIAIHRGATTVVMRVPDPVQLLETLEAEAITHTFVVPALLQFMVQVPGVAGRDYSSLRVLSYGASPMPLPLLRTCLATFPNVFYQVYGMTEASGAVTTLGPAEHADTANEHRLTSAGTPMPGVQIEVRDPVTGGSVPVGEPGEICVRSEQLMSGYWGRPADTEAAIGPDGWLRSGDGGHLDGDGYVYVTDRIKDMIVSGGENIYPAEIERVLVEHPLVADVAVIGVPDATWGEVPKAIVVAVPGTGVDEAELLGYCRGQLARFKCPKSVDVVDELPRNPTGKVLKRELRAPYWAGRERSIG